MTNQDAQALLKLIDQRIDARVPIQTPKWYPATVISASGGSAVVHLPSDPSGVNLTVQNPREISLEVGDQVSLLAFGSLSNTIVDFRKDITLNSIYTDYNVGIDDYKHGSSNAPFKTLQYAINRLSKNLNKRNIVIRYANPNATETLQITSFYGGGTITIIPQTGTSVSYIDYIYLFGNIGMEIDIYHLGATNAAVSPRRAAIWVRNSSYVVLDNCNVTTAAAGYGISIDDGSKATVRNTEISNRGYGLLVESLSYAFSQNNSGTGNTYGIGAFYSSYLGKSGTQPAGITSENKDSSSTIQ